MYVIVDIRCDDTAIKGLLYMSTKSSYILNSATGGYSSDSYLLCWHFYYNYTSIMLLL